MTNLNAGHSDEVVGGMGVNEYIRVARIYWKSIAVVTIIVTLLATLWGVLQPRIYAAEASAIVLTVGSENVDVLLSGDTLAKSKIKNYESIAESRLLADRVIETANLDTSADALLKTITVSVPLETAEIRISAKSPDPATAQRVADAWITELAKQVQQLETSAAVGAPRAVPLPAVGLVALDMATLPTSPISPNVGLAALFGVAGGLLLAYAAALFRHHLDRRLRSVAEIERLFDVPVIGRLPLDERLSSAGAATLLDAECLELPVSGGRNHAFTEALRALRTNMKFLDVDNPPRVIVVTSSVTSEGKSTVVGNLALTMAAAGDPVVVVDGDLRRPRLAAIFNVVPGVGVTNVLSGQATLSEVLQDWGELANLSVLGSGPTPPNPSELLGSEAMKQMLKTLSAHATVLIDAPPLLAVTDAAILSQLADGVIVVARAGRTTRDELAQAFANLRRVKASILGTIVNCVPTRGVDAYPYYGAYIGEPGDVSSTASEESSQSELSNAVTRIVEDKAHARSAHLVGKPADGAGPDTGPAADHLEASRQH